MSINRKTLYNPYLVLASSVLIGLGFVMVASSSIAIAEGRGISEFFYAQNQAVFLLLSLLLGWLVTYIPMRFWRKISMLALLGSILLLLLILLPGVSRSINGSKRWLFIGPLSLQVSEFVKLAIIFYIASYLVRYEEQVQQYWSGFLKPLGILLILAVLLLLEPDFGALVVITGTVLGMLFLAQVPWYRFLSLFSLVVLGFIILSVASPYRMARLVTFLNPWADQFNTGYQLTQSLIAFGRGGWFGLGLGASIQKLLYLPEAHTDFLFAVLAEELGVVGVMVVISFFIVLVLQAFKIGQQARVERHYFAAYVAFGIGLWFAIQTLINMGVNVGILPTKGLTLPLMSYGRASLMVTVIALALLFRIDFEARLGCKQ